MNFCWCTVYVSNMEESLWFYQEIVGLSIDRRYKGGAGVDIVFLGDGETKVELICDASHKASGNFEGISMGFEVKSLNEKMEYVKEKGVDINGGPFQPNSHVKFFFVKDPNGLTIQFVENIV